MSEDIKTVPDTNDVLKVLGTMLAQQGSAVLDLVSALTPRDPAARRAIRRQLKQALRRVPATHGVHQDLLQIALREMRR